MERNLLLRDAVGNVLCFTRPCPLRHGAESRFCKPAGCNSIASESDLCHQQHVSASVSVTL